MWILNGSVPLFTAFGIRVRAHSSLVLFIGLVLLFGLGQGYTWQDRVFSMTALFGIVLLHEFGHCFSARWVGGEAEDILMHPLGGLAFAKPPHRPLPTFITVAGGPMVNVIICIICGTILFTLTGKLPWSPFYINPFAPFSGWMDVAWYAYWIYQMSYTILLFNLLPIFPLDGGQIVQSALWPIVGYYKSMYWSCTVGMVAAVLGGVYAIASGRFGLAILAVFGFMGCMNMRRQLIAAGPYAFSDGDFSATYDTGGPSQRTLDKQRARREKNASIEKAERAKVDRILAKVAAKGMHSLNWLEKRVLKQATDRQRKADLQRAGRA